jgi:MoxR-like ATPase
MLRLQVAAYTSGRSSVSQYDCLLLQHVLWQRPDECERISDHIIKHFASNEKAVEQTDYIFQGKKISILLFTQELSV